MKNNQCFPGHRSKHPSAVPLSRRFRFVRVQDVLAADAKVLASVRPAKEEI